MIRKGFLAQLLISRKIRFKDGEIDFFDCPCAIMPIPFLKYLNDGISKDPNYSELKHKTYISAWKSGFIFMKDIVKYYGLKPFEERYYLAMDLISLSGFGDYQTRKFYPGYADFIITGNPFAKFYYKTTDKVDYLLRGFNAGGGTVVHERIMNCVELECAAQNGKYCHHINMSQNHFDEFEKDLIKSQLDTKRLIKEQREFLDSIGYTQDRIPNKDP